MENLKKDLEQKTGESVIEEEKKEDIVFDEEKNEGVVVDEEKNGEDLKKQAEREEFDLEEGIEFQEVITKEDALNFNFYIQNNSSNFSRRLFTSLLGILMIWYVLNIKQYYGLIIIGLVIIVYSLYLYIPIQRKLTKRMFDKKGFEDLTVNIKLASKIKYELASETISPLVPYEVIKQVVKTQEYIYLHLSPYSVIIIKLSDCGELKEQVIEFIKDKFVKDNKYKEKLK